MRINMPVEVEKIIDKLNENGYEAYAVGGCIRDAILGREPNDWDITTSAMPLEVKGLFNRTVDTGLQHGTVTILLGKGQYEVTTYRIDGEYDDHRRPNDVEFTTDLVKDLERRDFTINAMAYNHEEGLRDPFEGVSDIDRKLIRCVGNPNARFNEDALRMLRAIRFSAQLGFRIDVNTRKSIKYNAHLIEKISGERIKVELDKTLCSTHPDYVKLLVKFNIMDRIMSEFLPIVGLEQQNPYHYKTVDEHTYETMLAIDNDLVLRWTMFLHDVGKGYTKTVDEKGIGHFYGHPDKSVELSRDILNRLRFDNYSKNRILKLIEYHDMRFESTLKSTRRAVAKIGDDYFEDYIKVQKADIAGQSPELYEPRIKELEVIEAYFKTIREDHQCVKIKDLQVSGKDLIDIGLAQGKMIGVILGKLLEEVIEEPSYNNAEWLLRKAKDLIEKSEK